MKLWSLSNTGGMLGMCGRLGFSWLGCMPPGSGLVNFPSWPLCSHSLLGKRSARAFPFPLRFPKLFRRPQFPFFAPSYFRITLYLFSCDETLYVVDHCGLIKHTALSIKGECRMTLTSTIGILLLYIRVVKIGLSVSSVLSSGSTAFVYITCGDNFS
jgi:hypothetical protein